MPKPNGRSSALVTLFFSVEPALWLFKEDKVQEVKREPWEDGLVRRHFGYDGTTAWYCQSCVLERIGIQNTFILVTFILLSQAVFTPEFKPNEQVCRNLKEPRQNKKGKEGKEWPKSNPQRSSNSSTNPWNLKSASSTFFYAPSPTTRGACYYDIE